LNEPEHEFFTSELKSELPLNVYVPPHMVFEVTFVPPVFCGPGCIVPKHVEAVPPTGQFVPNTPPRELGPISFQLAGETLVD